MLALQVFVAVNGEFAGVLTLSDTVRPEAAATVAQLQREGFQTILLTGGLTLDLHFALLL